MSRLARALVLVTTLVLAALVSACGATPPPPDIAKIQATPLGQALKALGYTPVSSQLDDNGNLSGYVYVNCGNDANLSRCGSNMHSLGTSERPNIYATTTGKITQLEGPVSNRSRTYRVNVPASYQDYMSLNEQQRRDLLSIMPEVARAVGIPYGRYTSPASQISTKIGIVNAWVQ